MESEAEVLGYGISLILLNVGTYVGVPVIIIIWIRKKFWNYFFWIVILLSELILAWTLDSTGESGDWDDYYKNNDVQTMPWFLEKLDPDLINEIESKALKDGNFLDLGTGPGTQAKQLSSLGFDVIGSDLSQSAIDKAKKLYSEPHFVIDDILKDPITLLSISN